MWKHTSLAFLLLRDSQHFVLEIQLIKQCKLRHVEMHCDGLKHILSIPPASVGGPPFSALYIKMWPHCQALVRGTWAEVGGAAQPGHSVSLLTLEAEGMCCTAWVGGNMCWEPGGPRFIFGGQTHLLWTLSKTVFNALPPWNNLGSRVTDHLPWTTHTVQQNSAADPR